MIVPLPAVGNKICEVYFRVAPAASGNRSASGTDSGKLETRE